MGNFEEAFREMVDAAIDTAIHKYSAKIEKVAHEREKHLRPSDIAKQLQVGRQTVFNWMNSGRLPYEKFGPQEFRIRPEDYQDFLDSNYFKKSVKGRLVKVK